MPGDRSEHHHDGIDRRHNDEAALAMLRGARGPAFMTGMAGDRIAVTVPVTFSLTQ